MLGMWVLIGNNPRVCSVGYIPWTYPGIPGIYTGISPGMTNRTKFSTRVLRVPNYLTTHSVGKSEDAIHVPIGHFRPRV